MQYTLQYSTIDDIFAIDKTVFFIPYWNRHNHEFNPNPAEILSATCPGLGGGHK